MWPESYEEILASLERVKNSEPKIIRVARRKSRRVTLLCDLYDITGRIHDRIGRSLGFDVQ